VTRTVWLASYPKSGNTWLRMLIANLSAKNDAPIDINNPPERGGIAGAREPFDNLLLIESGLLTPDETDCLRPRVLEEMARGAQEDDFDIRLPPREAHFLKAHDAYILTPKGEPLLAGSRGAGAAVVIVRDPRDVACSLAHHLNSSIDHAIAVMSDENAAICGHTDRQMKQLRQRVLTWSGHVKSWLDQTDIPVHMVRYEEMKADAAETLRRVLAFAGRVADDDAIRRAVALADFNQLCRQELENGFREAPRPISEAAFFRRGVAGGWRDELTAEQVARIEAAHAPMMLRLGYELSSEPDLAIAG
jgi:aryl sulfotransferase